MNALLREFMMPAVKNLQMRIDHIEQGVSFTKSRMEIFFDRDWPTITRAVESLTNNSGRIEKDVDRLERAVNEWLKRLDDVSLTTEKRLGELKMRDDLQEVRLRALEDFALTLKVKVAMISVGISGVVAVVVWVLNKYT
jgi:hypothetical protein